MFKAFVLLYADDIVLFVNSAEELQQGLTFYLIIARSGN